MAVTKVLARDWSFKIGASAINGVQSFTVAPSKTDADTSDFESAGFNEHLPAARGYVVTLEGFHLEDNSTGARDAGQAAVETSAGLVGPTALSEYTMTSPGGNIWTFDASAQVDGPSGSTNDAATWKATLTVSGSIAIT